MTDIATIFLATTTTDAVLSVTQDSVQIASSSASSSARSTGNTATEATEKSSSISGQIAIKQLNIPNNPDLQYNTTVTNTTNTQKYCYKMNDCNCDCANDCDVAYYEKELKTWGQTTPDNTNNTFLWGAATSAFQVEGAPRADGKGPSIWDEFQKVPGAIYNGDNANIACNSYHQYEDDRKLLQNMGCNAYRFSIAWTRILPTGKGQVNQKGIDHYNKVIDDLIKHNITPLVTLYHWDLPLGLQEEYNGWLCKDKQIAIDFANYADICFKNFGDRVKFWATINEAQTTSVDAYEYNWFAPADGNAQGISPDGIEYIAAHNQLLAHAYAAKVYREKYAFQNGKIGFVCNRDWAEPYTNSKEDIAAAERNLQFWGGWFWDPIFFGHYPEVMVKLVGDRLPKFTPEESKMIQGSIDVFLWNTYSAQYFYAKKFDSEYVGWTYDQQNQSTASDPSGCLIGPPSQSSWLHITPFAIKKNLVWIQNRYGNGKGTGIVMKLPDGSMKQLPLMITEFGVDILGQVQSTPYDVAKKDCERIYYYKSYLTCLKDALKVTGVDFAGCFPWALIDNFEWATGYNARFGINYVDFLSDPVKRPRLPKYTSIWYRDFISTHPNGL